MMSLLRRKPRTISSIEPSFLLERRRLFAIFAYCLVIAVASCELRTPPALITVYNPAMRISVPIPQGWRSELGDQSGFRMHTFTGPSVDVPERPGIRAQVMLGPMPKGKALDELSTRYTEGHTVTQEQGYSLHGFAGKTWFFQSEDGAESSRLMLTDLEGRLYGIYIHGESPTMDANRRAIDAMWEGLSVEEARFFEVYERPDIGLFLKHPRSWERTAFLSRSGESLFVAFRSPPLLLEEGGSTIHATLEVTVNQVEPGTTLESYYTGRADIQGDNYRLLSHDVINEGDAISDLYHIETQLAQHLERTLYFIRGDKSYIFKFNCQNTIYRQIEPWVEEMIMTFAPREVT
jgi:hypothetical protein